MSTHMKKEYRISNHHNQTFSNNQHSSSTAKIIPKRISHAMIQALHITPSINNSSFLKTNDTPLIPNVIDVDTYRSQSKNSFITQKSLKLRKSLTNAVSITRIHRHFLPRSQSTEQAWTSYNFNVLWEQKRPDLRATISKVKKCRSSFSKVAYHERKDAWSNDSDITLNHDHQNLENDQKKICTKQCVSILIISSILVIAVTIATLLIFFIQPQTISTTTTSSKVVLLRWNTSGITITGIANISGNTSDQLNEPWDLALDWSNTLYVTDQKNNRVQKFLMRTSEGITVAGQANTTGGLSLSYLRGPLGIVHDNNNNIYVSDNNNNRIVVWSNNALTGSLFAGTGTSGTSLNQLDDPHGIARDLDSGAVYIADYNNHRIMRYFQNNSSGTLVAGGNGNGKNNTQLSLPTSIHFDSLTNSLIIVNTGAHNIVRWTLGANNWILVAGSINGTSGTSSTYLKSPTDVTFDPMGNMYVADRNNHRIQFFPVGESNATTIAGLKGITGVNSTLLNTPSSLILDNQLNMYVVDRFNHRIQKFVRY